MLITLTNTKGGVGKSTLAANLAIWLFDLGYRVALLDTDPQGTSSEWVQNAEKGISVRSATEMESIQKAVGELTNSHDFVIADAPGEEGEAANTVILLSDFAILPLQPTKPDVRALKGALKTIRLAHAVTQGRRPEAVLVLNCVRKRNRKTAILKEQLKSHGLRVADADVRRLDALADSCDGAVTRDKSERAKEAASDLNALFAELLSDTLSSRRVSNG
jgi:chromosome partitioning protein